MACHRGVHAQRSACADDADGDDGFGEGFGDQNGDGGMRRPAMTNPPCTCYRHTNKRTDGPAYNFECPPRLDDAQFAGGSEGSGCQPLALTDLTATISSLSLVSPDMPTAPATYPSLSSTRTPPGTPTHPFPVRFPIAVKEAMNDGLPPNLSLSCVVGMPYRGGHGGVSAAA